VDFLEGGGVHYFLNINVCVCLCLCVVFWGEGGGIIFFKKKIVERVGVYVYIYIYVCVCVWVCWS
jgi:hypothetical protein